MSNPASLTGDIAADPGPLREPIEPAIDPASPDRFVNRELSWLAFNRRVLEESRNRRHPLLERMRFLSISASNLDEFFMVRVAGLKGMVKEGVATQSADGLMPAQQLDQVDAMAKVLIEDQQAIWLPMCNELRDAGIAVIEADEVTEADRGWLDVHFREQIFPVLTPLAIDPAHPFPFIPNLGFTLAARLTRAKDGKTVTALVPIPPQLQRFIRLPDVGRVVRFLPLEKVVTLYLHRLFPDHDTIGSGVFRVLRDSDIEVEEEAEDLMLLFETLLKRRRRGSVIHMKCGKSMPDDLREFLIDQLDLETPDLVIIDRMLGLSDLQKLILDERRDLQFKPYVARFPERIRDHGGDCFAAIREKDIVVHHPFESFDAVVQFLRQAAASTSAATMGESDEVR